MKLRFLFALIAVTFLAMPAASAEWFDGDVDKVDMKSGTLTISEVDPITEAAETEEIVIGPATVFSGVKSLKDLRKGDDVTIEAKYDEPTDSWTALSVEMAEAGE